MWQNYEEENRVYEIAYATTVVNFNGGGSSSGINVAEMMGAPTFNVEMMAATSLSKDAAMAASDDGFIDESEEGVDISEEDVGILDMFENDGAHYKTAAFLTSTAILSLTVNIF